jgi:hypothetical protein
LNTTLEAETSVEMLAVELAVEPAAEEPTVQPAVEVAVEPAVKPAVEVAVEPAVKPAVEPAVELAVEPAVEPAVGLVVEPKVEMEMARRNFLRELEINGWDEEEILEYMEKEKVGGWEELFAWVFPPLPRYPEQCRFCRIRNSNVSWDGERKLNGQSCKSCCSKDEMFLFMKYAPYNSLV